MQFRDAKGRRKVFSCRIIQPLMDTQAFNSVQSSSAFDASCSCSCGKETPKFLPSVSHMLVCVDGAREEWLFLHKES